MPDNPDGFESGFDADGRPWFGFIDRDLTRWEKVECLSYPEGVTPAQVLKDLTEE